jgi:diamine N-acetyltransferase
MIKKNDSLKLLIRPATINDVKMISEVGKNSFIDAFGEFNTKENLNRYVENSFSETNLISQFNAGHIFYLALLKNIPVGYLKLNPAGSVPDVSGLNSIQLERIYIRKRVYNKGFGKQLLNTAIKYCKEQKIDYVWLGVWQQNERAIDFYLKYNFTKIGTKLFKIGDNITKDFIMLLKIN